MSFVPPARSLLLTIATLTLACAAGTEARATHAQGAAAPRTGAAAIESRTIPFGNLPVDGKLEPFFADTKYDTAIPTPDSMLRQPLGAFIAHHHEILAYLRALETKSPRIKVVPFGRTHEGRELVYAVIGTPENIQKLDSVRADLAKLADPRSTSAAEADRIVKSAPAVAWLGYSIHGDETSGSDASMAVAHHFVAGTSADVTDLLKSVVVVIDPCLNPDGRERILSQIEQSTGYVQNLDTDSMHRGRWPFGRGNHYLFDMNRDWVFGSQPETRARWKAIQSFHPQLLVDAHEMGALDTFLFYPATAPFTPFFPEATRKWWERFGADQSAAFDRRGWSYYTREWADSYYPGYSDSWGSFNGAIGILYEQARYGGQSVRRASGEVATYRGAVERQAVSSVANVATLAAHKEEILRDYVEAKRKNVSAEADGNGRMFVLVPGQNADRDASLVDLLAGQGVEVYRAEAKFTGANVDTVRRGRLESREFPEGSIVVPARQPLATLVKAFLAFDPRYDKDSLARERTELERKQRSKIYDVTAWCPAHLFDVDGSWCDAVDVRKSAITALPAREKGVVSAGKNGAPVYGWVVDGDDDRAVAFAAGAMELGLNVLVSDEPFTAAGRPFPRYSILVRRLENADDAPALVARACDAAEVRAYAVATARSTDDGPDLGGQRFQLLARPRVALLSNTPVAPDAFGHTWHMLDAELGLPCTLIDAQSFGGADLRRYNVLVLPDTWGGIGAILSNHAESLRAWVRGGGTLIASGDAAAAVASKDLKLSSVRSRSDALEDLARYAESVRLEREAGKQPIDEALVWGDDATAEPAKDGGAKETDKPDAGAKRETEVASGSEELASKTDATSSDTAKTDAAPKPDAEKDRADKSASSRSEKPEDLARRDRRARIYSPRGTILRGEVNRDAWLSAGCGDELPILFEGSSVLLSELPVRTPVRFAAAERLRISGLLWPEARERVADSAYATVESLGAGQVILFASSPDFRGWTRGTARLLANAVVYGPGLGANQPLGW